MTDSTLIQSLVDRLSDDLMIVDRWGTVSYQNEGSLRTVGKCETLAEFVDGLTRLMVLSSAESAASIRSQVDSKLEDYTHQGDLSSAAKCTIITYEDSCSRQVHLLAQGLDADHVVLIGREATASREDHTKRYMVSRLATGLAHNLNNMLMIIEPCLEALSEVVPESHQDFVVDATEAGQRSSELIRQLMTVAGQSYPAIKQSLRFSQLCAQAVAQCQNGSQSLRLEFDAHSSSEVIAAPSALSSVISTLLKSASALRERESTSTTRTETEVISAGQKTLTAQVQDIFHDGVPCVELLLENHRSMLSENVRTRIFEPFFRTSDAQGTGLELAMSEAIVRQYGGELTCRPIGNYGTAFSLILPAAEPATKPRTTL